MEIIFLGTGAALPTLNRWPSAIAVERNGEILLFDCGEGTQMRFQQAGLKPGKLRKIFISHFHGDHFYGLMGFLTSLQLNGRTEPLNIYAPDGLSHFLAVMQRISHSRLDYAVNVVEVSARAAETIWEFGDYLVTASALQHSLFSLGFRLEEKPLAGRFDTGKAERLGIPAGPERAALIRGESIVLSSGRRVRPEEVVAPPRPGLKFAICVDTRPCNAAVKLATEVDVLIHDSSFADDMCARAKKTGHSTTAEAAGIAAKANAKQLVLTHISARYKPEDEARLLSQAQNIFPNTVLATDLLRMPVKRR